MPSPLKNKKEELFVLTPKKTENRGKYLQRCSAHPKMREQFKDMKERMGMCLNAFNSYYRYWSRLEEFGEDLEGTALGDCIAKKRAQGLDYKQAYASCSTKVVAPSGPIVLSEDEDNLIIEPVAFNEMDILGYMTKYFYICPGAQTTFEHLISMNPDKETSRMIRNAAVLADSVFKIEAKVLEDEVATPEQLEQATVLVDDFYGLMSVIDDDLGMFHDVSYMDGHLEVISSYIK
jgi:hypothetical protein